MKKSQRATTLLNQLRKQCENGRVKITLDDALQAFGRRASAPLLFMLAVFLVSPLGGIPGVAPLFGAVIVLIAGQSLFSDTLWLPQWLRKRGTTGAKARKAIDTVTPWVARMERTMRPRITWLTAAPFHWIGDLTIVAVGGLVPLFGLIPGGLILPGLAIALLSIARLHDDGVWALAGYGLATAAFISLLYAASENVF